jgi:hypothetical protein
MPVTDIGQPPVLQIGSQILAINLPSLLAEVSCCGHSRQMTDTACACDMLAGRGPIDLPQRFA